MSATARRSCPSAVVVDPNFDWRGEYRRRNVPWDQTIIYEAHVKGFTKLHPAVDEHLRGTYAGLGVKGSRRLRQVAGRDLGRIAARSIPSSTTVIFSKRG